MFCDFLASYIEYVYTLFCLCWARLNAVDVRFRRHVRLRLSLSLHLDSQHPAFAEIFLPSCDFGLKTSVTGTVAVNGNSKVEEFDAVIVGAGFGGIYLLHTLRKLGYKVNAKELWDDWAWKERFPCRGELVRNFEHVDKKWDLQKDILFNNAVIKADFDESSNTWTAITNKGYIAKAPFLPLATGFAAEPYSPKIKGLETFKSPAYNTVLWSKEGVELKGKKVGIIGTGSSGVQVIQEIAPIVEHLTIFQHTANLALRMVREFYDEKTV
ncbi:uncharacterized protein A1O5_11423 [Cladophialophora psammophila CBS 110553]|uniref:FAD/NAD(P)-binding domain-containing protein n=1 Tax=Cladophialophora psammophila CBS 110553 TaxID=1182543 RepID=W9W6D9_9EURO|nr:uncharacterized protein A1O5_11423 [Cladophialophora psammophila CBS 110553]EXJ63662.1 hypothetical protein A1O5_11423 [Cladophialophora psammophila CBS 110553]